MISLIIAGKRYVSLKADIKLVHSVNNIIMEYFFRYLLNVIWLEFLIKMVLMKLTENIKLYIDNNNIDIRVKNCDNIRYNTDNIKPFTLYVSMKADMEKPIVKLLNKRIIIDINDPTKVKPSKLIREIYVKLFRILFLNIMLYFISLLLILLIISLILSITNNLSFWLIFIAYIAPKVTPIIIIVIKKIVLFLYGTIWFIILLYFSFIYSPIELYS